MNDLKRKPRELICLRFLMKSLRFFGLWNTSDINFYYKCYSLIIVSLQLSYLCWNIFTVFTKSSEWKSMSNALEDLIIGLSSAFSCYKVFILVKKLKVVLQGIEKLNTEWKQREIRLEEDEELMHSSCRFEKKLSQIMFANAQIIASALILSGISRYVRNLHAWRRESEINNSTMPFPYAESLPYISPFKITGMIPFIAVWIYMGINLVLTAQLSTIVDCVIWLWTYHVSNYFEILTRKIRRISSNHDQMRSIVEFHKELISESKNIQNVLGPIMFLQFGISSLMICLGLYQITQVDSSTPMLYVKHIFYLTYKIVQMYMNCWFGQRLMDKSEGVGWAVYSSDFYNYLNKSTLATCRIMILRASKPCQISAFKTVNISLKAFRKVMDSSYSLFTLLKSF